MHAGRALFVTLIVGCTPVQPDAPPEPSPILLAPVRAIELDELPAKPRSALDDPDGIGIGPCDEYRERFGRCITDTVPEAMREPLRDALDASWLAWTEAAIGPAVVGLPAACRAALDAAKEATRSLGCTWARAPHAYGPVGIEECDAYVFDYGQCIATRVPALRREAMLAELVAQTKEWQDTNVPPFHDDTAAQCAEARAAARQATGRYGCEL